MSIIMRFTRPALPIRDGTFGEPGGGWLPPIEADLRATLDAHRESIEGAIGCVGRIEFEGHPYLEWAGTGVLVAPYLFLTARHVANLFARGQGDSGITLNTDIKAFLAAGGTTGSRDEFRLPVTRVRFLHPFFDVALCELGPGLTTQTSEDAELGIPLGLRLAAAEPAPIAGRKVAVIGFAATDRRNEPADEERIFGSPIGPNLHLMPGELGRLDRTLNRPTISHDCSTSGGSAGAPLVDLETGEVLGIHFGGRPYLENWATPSWLLATDPRVRASGIQFSDDPDWLHMWALADIANSDSPVKLAPDPAMPEPDPEIHYFTPTELYRIRDLLVATGLARPERQHLLVIGMSLGFISTLPTGDTPDVRLLQVLNILNQTHRLNSGELPMRTFLLNAVENSKVFTQSAKLREYLDRLPPGG